MMAEANSQLITESNVSVLEEATSNLHISDARHVIFRNHLQIPEALKNGLVFEVNRKTKGKWQERQTKA